MRHLCKIEGQGPNPITNPRKMARIDPDTLVTEPPEKHQRAFPLAACRWIALIVGLKSAVSKDGRGIHVEVMLNCCGANADPGELEHEAESRE